MQMTGCLAHHPPIGGHLYKKFLELFSQKLNIFRKKGKFNLKIIVSGSGSGLIFHRPNVHDSINERGNITTIWPNRNDHDHGLIITIDADSQRTNDQDNLCF
jgi:hypothetical protein